jgi:hypothetical protein
MNNEDATPIPPRNVPHFLHFHGAAHITCDCPVQQILNAGQPSQKIPLIMKKNRGKKDFYARLRRRSITDRRRWIISFSVDIMAIIAISPAPKPSVLIAPAVVIASSLLVTVFVIIFNSPMIIVTARQCLICTADHCS